MGLLIATPPSVFRSSSRARRQLTITTGSGSLSRLYSSFTTAASGTITLAENSLHGTKPDVSVMRGIKELLKAGSRIPPISEFGCRL